MSEIIASTYEIIEKLGSGGGGNVYLAKHLRLGIRVVLKADKRKLSTDLSLLRREVDILKELNYPGIPRVQDFFAVGETVYTAMDYIEGESLDKPLKRGERFSQPQVIEWAKELLKALSYLHSPTHGNPPRGFVHSDIKPANLMRTPDNQIYLIDFNIALALGETQVIGCSAGYASPEHYGLDFSVDEEEGSSSESQNNGAYEETATITATAEMQSTVTSADTDTMVMKEDSGELEATAVNKIIVPDARSDIYSTGATLYHLLSGKRPPKNAKEVIPLSETEFSPPLVRIITKAMEPNPNRRYQTAEEMLDALCQLREKDPRTRRWKRQRMAAFLIFPPCILAGALFSFIGLKRMETTESWLKACEYAQNALEHGDVDQAAAEVLQAFPEKTTILTPASIPEAQKTLTDVLGVYDLSDGYKDSGTAELPSETISLKISPEGNTAAAVCQGFVEVFDTNTGEILTELPTVNSALAEVNYLDENTIIYAGEEGLTSYNIKEERNTWTGAEASFIGTSADGKRIAAVYKDESAAKIYDALNGNILYTIDFENKKLSVAVNDLFANPNDNILALNQDGSWLGVSFDDGSLMLYQMADPENTVTLMQEGSGFTHFEGGFFGQYFAFSASRDGRSVFAIVDTETMEQTGGFESESRFSVQTDETGIYVQTGNYLVKIDPVTGEQIPLVSTSENILGFSRCSSHTLISVIDGAMLFDTNAQETERLEQEGGFDFLQIAGDTALLGNMDSPVIRILRYENHPESEIFTYDPAYLHNEARISEDKKTVMLFSYQKFRIYEISGRLLCEVNIPDAAQVYDQQFIREEGKSYLDVIYNSGKVCRYDASDGSLISEWQGEAHDSTFREVFYTDQYSIESPLHGDPIIYDRKSGKEIKTLAEDAFLTYVTQIENYIIVQYTEADGRCYGQLFNDKFELLADLPYLCDIYQDSLVFDYPTGNIRQTRIYDINELVSMARKQHTQGGEET